MKIITYRCESRLSRFHEKTVVHTDEAVDANAYAAQGWEVTPLYSIRGVQNAKNVLQAVATWELPETGDTWPDSGDPVSYEAKYGSLGARAYIQEIARLALAKLRIES